MHPMEQAIFEKQNNGLVFLYNGGDSLLRKIDKPLGECAQQNNDYDEKDSKNRCGNPEIERRNLVIHTGIGRPDHFKIVKDCDTGIDYRKDNQCVHIFFNCGGENKKLSGKTDGRGNAGQTEGADSQG